MLCPICKKPVNDRDDSRTPNPSFPFCGERCKLIDLGRWLGERYQIPVKPTEPPTDMLPPDVSGDD